MDVFKSIFYPSLTYSRSIFDKNVKYPILSMSVKNKVPSKYYPCVRLRSICYSRLTQCSKKIHIEYDLKPAIIYMVM